MKIIKIKDRGNLSYSCHTIELKYFFNIQL